MNTHQTFKEKQKKFQIIISTFIISIIIILIAIVAFRFDYAGGTHLITPTAIDNTLFGNLKLYYKTSVFTGNGQEDFYYIERGDAKILLPIINDAILHGKQIIVHYPPYIGFKGILAPPTAPIKSIDIIKKRINK